MFETHSATKTRKKKGKKKKPNAANHAHHPNPQSTKKRKRRGSSKLMDKFSKKMKGARFRWLNEQLYTTESAASLELFTKEPTLFDVYHAGFAEQVKQWPVNPLDIIIRRIKAFGRGKALQIADFGCGEARLADELDKDHTVHSFDLVSRNKKVIACDIANVPLEASSVDVAVFCLALMGTNYCDFLREAHRVLKRGGHLLIAEVESRLSHGVQEFQQTLMNLGFGSPELNTSHPFFTLFFLRKVKKKAPKKKFEAFELKPCRYKKR